MVSIVPNERLNKNGLRTRRSTMLTPCPTSNRSKMLRTQGPQSQLSRKTTIRRVLRQCWHTPQLIGWSGGSGGDSTRGAYLVELGVCRMNPTILLLSHGRGRSSRRRDSSSLLDHWSGKLSCMAWQGRVCMHMEVKFPVPGLQPPSCPQDDIAVVLKQCGSPSLTTTQ